MPYCTVVEFEWTDDFTRGDFESGITSAAANAGHPPGRLARIAGIDDHGARMIEVWQSAEAARAFAESAGPPLSEARMPRPVHILGFEVSEFEVTGNSFGH